MNVEPIPVQKKRKSHPGVIARKRIAKYKALQLVSASRPLGVPGDICTAPPPVVVADVSPVLPVRKALVARLLEAEQRLAEQTKELAFVRKRLHSAESQLESQIPLIRSLKTKAETYRRSLLEQLALASLSAPPNSPGSFASHPDPI